MAKSDGTGAFDSDAIKKVLLKAKSQGGEFNFAFGLASKPQECGLIVHIRKSGLALKKQIIAEPGIRKSCFGVLMVDGADVRLQPRRPLKGIVRQLKRKFRDEGLQKFRPVLVDPDGQEIDEEELPDADQYDDSEDDVSVDPEALKARLIQIGKSLKTLGNAAPAELIKDTAAAAKLLRGKELDDAETAVAAIEEALGKLAPPEKVQSPESKLKQALIDRIGKIREMPAGAARTRLMTMARDANDILQGNDPAASLQALKDLSVAMQKTTDGALKEGITDAEDGHNPAQIWRDAKESIDGSIAKLQGALKGFDDEVLNRIAEFGLNGITEGNQTALNKALVEFRGATGAERATAAKALIAQTNAYQAFLSSDPILDLCEKNPFGIDVPIRQTLGSALKRINQAAAQT